MLDVHQSRIYIVDDEPANRVLLEAILAQAGFHDRTTFADGGAVLHALETQPEPDLVLLDLRMPVQDGLSVLRAMRTDGSRLARIPVLVLTADGTRQSRTQALASGANDFLTKPFDTAEVVLRVRNLLEVRRLHVELEARNVELRGELSSATQRLADREREWALQSMALSKLRPGPTAEATAQAVCDELHSLPGIAMTMIAALDAVGNAIPLARDAGIDIRIEVNRPLPRALIDSWRDRIGTGPYVGPWENAFGSTMRRAPGPEPTAMAVVPLLAENEYLGALVVGTSVQDGVPFLSTRLPLLESFAAVASALLADSLLMRQRYGSVRARTELLLHDHGFHPVFQPVVELATGRVVGHEALTRFDDGSRPDRVFADAAAVGLGPQLEAAAICAAVAGFDASLPDGWLSVNASPSLVTDRQLLSDAVAGARSPVVVEVTEHVAIEDYAAVRRGLRETDADLRLAVDDAGAGFASFRHILELRPDFVKLDVALIRDIDRDDVRQALVAGIVYFARKGGCQLIAEGIESEAELDQLIDLDVRLGQGFLLGRPAAAPAESVAR